MKDYIHYENDGKKWVWYPHSWTDGRTASGEWYVKKYYCTGGDGCGIFFVDLSHNERKQIVGTCDFSLNGLKDPRRAIRRWMQE